MTPTIAKESLHARVTAIVGRTPITDIHTHLFSPAFGPLLLRGIDSLLTYHYLVAEMFRWRRDLAYADYFSWDVKKQAETVWQAVFADHSPVSESARGVLTILQSCGVDVAGRSLDACRTFFDKLKPSEHVDLAMKLANVDRIVMTNDPFDPVERAMWDKGIATDKRFATALRIDAMFANWSHAVEQMRAMGFKVGTALTTNTKKEAARFVETWIDKIKPLYLMASLPPEFTVPHADVGARVFEDVVLPVAKVRGIAFAMMLGCRRQINPSLRLAGDGVARVDLSFVGRLCQAHPDNTFMLTVLARENQHEAIVLARKFRNILPFGCWWFVNSPILIEELTRMRLEWLGLSMIPQHSDARVMDQIIYKWLHSKEIIATVLSEKYADIERTGWRVTDADIERDVKGMFGGTFSAFIAER